MAELHTDDFEVGADVDLDAYGDWEEMNSAGDMTILAVDDSVKIQDTLANRFGRWTGTGAPDGGDQQATVDVTFLSSSGFGRYGGPVVRCQVDGSLEGYVLYAVEDPDATELYRIDGGSITLLDSDTADTFGTLTAYEMKLTVQGSALSGEVDGVERVTATDSNHAGGSAGLGAYTDTAGEVELDNFVLDDLASSVVLGLSIVGGFGPGPGY